MSSYRPDTAELVENSLASFEARRTKLAAYALKRFEQPTGPDADSFILRRDIYGYYAAFNLFCGEHIDAALDQIIRTSKWFDLPHPNGRDPRGESTFAAMGLLPSLYFCADKLSAEARAWIDRFFLTKNFESMYESENHRLQHHTAMYLAGQFYSDRAFEWMDNTLGCDIARREETWLKNFIRFRAKESWGEFDSCGYLDVDFGCLLYLADLSQDKELSGLARMMLDIVLMDMIVDSKNGLYGGAHGRIYPPSALNAASGGMQSLYYYYFGSCWGEFVTSTSVSSLLCSYRPNRVVLEAALGREGTYENREAKHLHCIPEQQQPGRISKYSYVTDKFIVGAVNHQDPYIAGTAQSWYAHHEQHELDALILADPRAKIFTHHPGSSKEHNRWTGDIGCCCATTYSWRNVAMSMYNIDKPDEFAYINAHFNRRIMKNVQQHGNWMFGELNGVYAALFGSNGWSWACDELRAAAPRSIEEHATDDDEIELWSEGRQHGCVIELSDTDENLNAFINRILANPVHFDPEARSMTYTTMGHTLYMDTKDVRTVDGVQEVFPYEMHDSPYLQSIWDDLTIRVNGFSGSVVYDFDAVTVSAV